MLTSSALVIVVMMLGPQSVTALPPCLLAGCPAALLYLCRWSRRANGSPLKPLKAKMRLVHACPSVTERLRRRFCTPQPVTQTESSSHHCTPASERGSDAAQEGQLDVEGREEEEWVYNRLVGWRDFEVLQPEIDYLKGAWRREAGRELRLSRHCDKRTLFSRAWTMLQAGPVRGPWLSESQSRLSTVTGPRGGVGGRCAAGIGYCLNHDAMYKWSVVMRIVRQLRRQRLLPAHNLTSVDIGGGSAPLQVRRLPPGLD